MLDLVNENIWMAENNNSLTLDDFRSDKYSELPLLDYVVSNYFVTSFIETEHPELRDLCKYVLPLYAAHWKKIGIFLNIKLGQLQVIQSDNPTDANGCCIDLFGKWLQGTDDVTWKKMFEAIDEATVSFSIDSVGTTTTTTTVTTSELYVRIVLELYCKLYTVPVTLKYSPVVANITTVWILSSFV